jgi:hypothetical protein
MALPQKKKDQLTLAQYGDKLPANRPDPDDPGGLGAEESGTERTGPTQDYLVAIQQGGRWAEVGRYYDYSNDPVTSLSWLDGDVEGPPHANSVATALLQRSAVGAIMSVA